MTEMEPDLFSDQVDPVAGDAIGGDLQTSDGLLALMSLPGIGSGRAVKLARAFVSAERFNEASAEQRRLAAGVSVEGLVNVRRSVTPHESVRLVGYFDAHYPTALRGIADAPAVLWLRGSLPDPARRVAVVGTRAGTPWGIEMARAIATDAAAAGVSVVSGLALGIDVAAHRAAVAAGGHTVAVLGSGIDRTTPREHITVAEDIVEAGGCILTEQPPGSAPSARTLVARNRLQSGLSGATIVVQCGLKSGTMSTARFALKQRRTLAIPEPSGEAEREHPENAGSLSLLDTAPPPVLLRSRGDLAALLEEIID